MPSGSQPSAAAFHGFGPRHTSLRIRLPSVDSKILQVDSARSAVPLEVVNEYSASLSLSCSRSCSSSPSAVPTVAVMAPPPFAYAVKYTPCPYRVATPKPGMLRQADVIR
jgi:hypothetical protein